MKVKKIAFLSLAALIATANIAAGTAFAAENTETVYPDSFRSVLTFENGLTDYAVYGETFAFAYNGQLIVLSETDGGDRLPDISAVSNIRTLDYVEGKLYVGFDGGYCIYPDVSDESITAYSSTYSKPEAVYNLSIDNAMYSLGKNSGKLNYTDSTGEVSPVTAEGYDSATFTNLKGYDGNAYAVMNNCLYSLDGATATKIDLTYCDYATKTKNIATGSAAEALRADGYEIKTAWIKSGAYYTEIDLSEELGTTFTVPDPATSTKQIESGDRLNCLVLAESGNASVVVIKNKSYLVATSSLEEEEYPTLESTRTGGAYSLERICVYSSPFMSEATRIAYLGSGEDYAVTVLGQYSFDGSQLYSKISYTADGESITGYVLDGFLTDYAFPAENYNENRGGEIVYDYGTNVTTVMLIIFIVLLVIIAIVYLMMVNGGKDEKNKLRKPNRKSDDDDVE